MNQTLQSGKTDPKLDSLSFLNNPNHLTSEYLFKLNFGNHVFSYFISFKTVINLLYCCNYNFYAMTIKCNDIEFTCKALTIITIRSDIYGYDQTVPSYLHIHTPMHPTFRLILFLHSGTSSPYGTPLFRGCKIWSCKNVHISLMYPLPLFIEGTRFFRGKGHLLCDLKPRLNLHNSGGIFLYSAQDLKEGCLIS